LSIPRAAVAAGLVVLTLVIFAQVRHHDFVNFDDYLYVTRNPNFEGGLTAKNVALVFRPYAAYWIPLTWLSLLVDYQLYGAARGVSC
jgi:protein O-mannosyl-transferase